MNIVFGGSQIWILKLKDNCSRENVGCHNIINQQIKLIAKMMIHRHTNSTFICKDTDITTAASCNHAIVFRWSDVCFLIKSPNRKRNSKNTENAFITFRIFQICIWNSIISNFIFLLFFYSNSINFVVKLWWRIVLIENDKMKCFLIIV